MRLITVILFSCVICAIPLEVPAQNANSHAKNGNSALRAGQYQKALTEFVLAYTHDASVDRLYDLGRAFEALKDTTAALTIYQQVVSRGPSRAASLASKRLTALSRGPSASGPQVSVVLNVIPPGAEVWINNTLKGRSPIVAFKVNRGQHNMEIRLAGYQTVRRTLNATSGASINQMVQMVPGASSPSPAQPAAAAMNLTITNIPAQSVVTLNGKQIAHRGNLAKIGVAAGNYSLRVSHAQMGTFSRQLTLGPGQSKTVAVQFKGASVGAPGGGFAPAANSVAGAWVGKDLSENNIRKISTTGSMTLAGTGSSLNGTIVLRKSAVLARWKARQCGANTATWETKYKVRASQQSGNWMLNGSGGTMSGCSCEGMCRSDNEFEWPLLVSKTKTVMLGDGILFVRKGQSGGTAGQVLKRAINLGNSIGKWHVQMESKDNAQLGTLSLSRTGGTFTLNSSQKLQRWKRSSCNQADTVTATHEYRVVSAAQGNQLSLTFEHNRTLKCSCRAACDSTIQRLGTQALYVTKDGRHMVGKEILMSRQ